jgi:branched-chain amino acid transport system permease protein
LQYLLIDLLALGSLNAIMVVGLNLQYGYAGLLNFAFYTFVAIGAYVAAVTTMGAPPTNLGLETYILQWSLPWPVGLFLGGLAAAALGALVFSFTVPRLRSDYLAIVTVALAFIVWTLINNFIPLFNGAQGLYGIPYLTGNAQVSIQDYSELVAGLGLLILAAFVWLSSRIFRSPYGRVLRAIREDEMVVTAFGRTVWQAQFWVYVLGCFMGGIAGGLLVFYITAWSPAGFLPLESFVLMAALIIGGSGNYWGALLGAFVLIEGLNELTRYLPVLDSYAHVGSIRVIVIGVGLILVLRFRPDGLLPERWLSWYGPASGRFVRLRRRIGIP